MLTEFFTKAPAVVQLIIGLAFLLVVLGWTSTLILTIVKLRYLHADERRKQARAEQERARQTRNHRRTDTMEQKRQIVGRDPAPDTWSDQVGHPTSLDPVSVSTPFWGGALPYGIGACNDTAPTDRVENVSID